MGAEEEDAIAWLDQGLGEVLLERLGPRGDDDILGAGLDAELLADPGGGDLPQLGEAEARPVAGLIPLDRQQAGRLGVGRAGERAVADLQLDNVLPLRLQATGQGQDGEGRLGGQVAGEGAQSRHLVSFSGQREAIAWASGRMIRGMTRSARISSPIARWRRNESMNDRSPPPQFWRTAK